MNEDKVIVVTGAAGFIGSCLVSFLNQKGYSNILVVDEFSESAKNKNLEGKKYSASIERSELFSWLEGNHRELHFFYHLGARTDTTEFDYSVHETLNVEYSKSVWAYCTRHKVPLVYASSAATYGGGELGYDDSHSVINQLKPLNPYGESKNEFDKWVIQKEAHEAPPASAGLKFFNVYGPNEYHKGRMASVIFHAFNQINTRGFVQLFKSHKPQFKDGEQLRDFIYVKDILQICYWFQECWEYERASFISGIYNAGTGKARSFIDLVRATFRGLDLEPDISFIDMPEDIRDTYQYFTEANMGKIREAGYHKKFFSLEEGIDDYVRNYLAKGDYF